MEIRDVRQNRKILPMIIELDDGQTFIFQDDLYIATNEEYDETDRYVARLKDGCLLHMDSRTTVMPVHTETTIMDYMFEKM